MIRVINKSQIKSGILEVLDSKLVFIKKSFIIRVLDFPLELLELCSLPSSYWEQFLDTSNTERAGTKIMAGANFLKLDTFFERGF